MSNKELTATIREILYKFTLNKLKEKPNAVNPSFSATPIYKHISLHYKTANLNSAEISNTAHWINLIRSICENDSIIKASKGTSPRYSIDVAAYLESLKQKS